MATKVSNPRWHQIPSPTDRITRLENLSIDVYNRIAEIHKAIGELRMEQDKLKEYVYDG